MAVLYLMKRTNITHEQCRIGVATRLSKRCIAQKAEAAWILQDGEKYMMILFEEVNSYRYGIPQNLWIGDNETYQHYLDTLWSYHGNNWHRGKEILRVFGIQENNPSWKKSQDQIYREDRQHKSWARLCDIDLCKKMSSCQSPNSCKGALSVPEFNL